MPTVLIVVALIWNTVLLAGGGVLLLRAEHVLQRVIALDLIAALMISLLALLCYLLGETYYLNAAVALALLSFIATVATARYLGSGGPFE